LLSVSLLRFRATSAEFSTSLRPVVGAVSVEWCSVNWAVSDATPAAGQLHQAPARQASKR
jgi:hypothetical protein